MRYGFVVLGLALCASFAASVCLPVAPSGPGPGLRAEATLRTEAYQAHVAALVSAHCLDCHSGEAPEAELDLSRLAETVPTHADLMAQETTWRQVALFLEGGAMPPEGVPPPERAEVEAAAGWIRSALAEARAAVPPDPGRITIRRLNRTEYHHTIRDLLGVEFDAADWLPRDEVGYGFDHIGDVLSLPPALFEKYVRAARHIAERAVIAVDPLQPEVQQFAPGRFRATNNAPLRAGGRALNSNGTLSAEARFVCAGTYIVRARAFGEQAGPDPVRMKFRVGSRDAGTVDVTAQRDAPGQYEVRVRVTSAGDGRVGVSFVNDYYKPAHPDPRQRDRNLVVLALEVEGPLADGLGRLPAPHRRIITRVPRSDGSDAREAAAAVIAPLARRAWRRPVSDADVERLGALVELAMAEGESFERGLQLVLQALLVSPNFLFRAELDSGAAAAPRDGPQVSSSVPFEPVGEHALACRLSYFLWSSMPDDALFAAAEAGTLRRDLDQHVTRMLADERARALVTNFGAQWLQLPRLALAAPDPTRFKSFDERLRESMVTETGRLLEEVFLEDRSILALLVSDHTHLDRRLAAHYGLTDLMPPKPGGQGASRDGFERVMIPADGVRGGLLSHASILTLTSYPTRTSPVIRGKYILEQLLDDPPPPPPPGVGVLETQTAEQKKLPPRERLALHRADPTCAVCHTRMDAMGFGLETFDGVGRTRTGERRVDATGTLPDGTQFEGPRELAILIAEDPAFPRAFATNLLTFALARGLEPFDRRALDAIVESAQLEGYRFSAFVRAIVHAPPFLERRR